MFICRFTQIKQSFLGHGTQVYSCLWCMRWVTGVVSWEADRERFLLQMKTLSLLIRTGPGGKDTSPSATRSAVDRAMKMNSETWWPDATMLEFVFMWMLLSITCVDLWVARAPTQHVGAISTPGLEIFPLCRTLPGISMTANVTLQVETSKIMGTCIRSGIASCPAFLIWLWRRTMYAQQLQRTWITSLIWV